MTLRQRIRFYQQLAVLVRAGLPIRTCLERLRDRMATPEVTVLTQKVNEGERIGEAFAAAGFTPFEANLVTAGEKSAQLEMVFEHLGEFWSRELELRQGMVRPLYYPIVVLHLAIVMSALIELVTTPWPTVFVHFVATMAFFYVVGIIGYTVVRVTWTSDLMRSFWLRVPMIGRALRTAYAYRWITALRIEFGAGIPLSRAVADAWRASDYVGCERFAEEGEQALRGGAQLSALMLNWKRLPRDWVDFIETGEVSGSLDAAFLNLEKEAARTWSRAQQLLAQWLPKFVYFFVLLVVAVQVGRVMYHGSMWLPSSTRKTRSIMQRAVNKV